jgi:hypothetical protein
MVTVMVGPLAEPDGGPAEGLFAPLAVAVPAAPPLDPLWFTDGDPGVPDPEENGLAQAAVAASRPIKNKVAQPRPSAERITFSPPECRLPAVTCLAAHEAHRQPRHA